jgi:Fur family transcriptional regulator, peroxide stress response regulator
MQKENSQTVLDKFFAICKEFNLKITPQRIAIFKELQPCKNHPSADTIFRAIKGDFPNISFDTVNRTLLTFSEIGLIDLVESYSGSRRFDPNQESHHHIHCIRCGDIIDFYNPDFDSLTLPDDVAKHNDIISKRVTVNVICFKCKNKKQQLSQIKGD